MINNKGFAVTSVLYTLLIAFLLFLAIALAQFSSSNKIFNRSNIDLTNNYSTFDFSSKGKLQLNYGNVVNGVDIINEIDDFPMIRTYYKVNEDYIKKDYVYPGNLSDSNKEDRKYKFNKNLYNDDYDNKNYRFIVSAKRTETAEENDYHTLLISFTNTNNSNYNLLSIPFNPQEYFVKEISDNILNNSKTAVDEKNFNIKSYETLNWEPNLMYCNNTSETSVASCDSENKIVLSDSIVSFGHIKKFLYQNILNSETYKNYSFLELVLNAQIAPKVRVFYRVYDIDEYDTNNYKKENGSNMLKLKNAKGDTIETNYSKSDGYVTGFPIKAKTSEEFGITKNGYSFNGWKAEIKYYVKNNSTSENENVKTVTLDKSEITLDDVNNYIKENSLDSNKYTRLYIKITFVAQWKEN